MSRLRLPVGHAWLRLHEAALGRSHQSGQGMTEYALILTLIAIVIIVILRVVGKQVSNVFSNVANGLNQ